MAKRFFGEEFIAALHARIPHRPDLVREIARILKIEKEPASRRLNNNVNFSIDEIAALAKELDISLDPLLHRGSHTLCIPHVFEQPWSETSMDSLAEMIESHNSRTWQIGSDSSDFGMVAGSLPLEFMMAHDVLIKYFLFKWGYFFIGSGDFNNYQSWQIPDRFHRMKERFRDCPPRGKMMYIWDDSLIWALARELEYLHVIHVIDDQSKEEIRQELHRMLTGLEVWVRGLNDDGQFQVSFYISSVQIGADSWFLMSERGSAAFFETHFTRTNVVSDKESCHEIREWVNSLRKISYMVSGSGEKQRKLFFEEQHYIVNLLLSGGLTA